MIKGREEGIDVVNEWEGETKWNIWKLRVKGRQDRSGTGNERD